MLRNVGLCGHGHDGRQLMRMSLGGKEGFPPQARALPLAESSSNKDGS